MSGAGTFFLVPLLLAFLAARLVPIWPTRHRGCDAYFFLQCAAAFRRDRRLPILLPPVYLLEPEEQWYPPGFAMFLALLPERWLMRGYWLLNHLLDAAVLLTLATVVGTQAGWGWGWAAALAYATSAFVVLEYSNLSSRPLGSLLLYGSLIAAFAGTQGSPAALALAVLLVAALLYTHKLSVQLLWFLAPFLGLTLGEPLWLLPLFAGYLLALVVGRGEFIKILLAHADIIAFWYRNWPLLGAHAIHDSPVYGGGPSKTGNFHRGSRWRGGLLHLRRMVQYNLWSPLALAAPVAADLDATGRFLYAWMIGTYLWAGLTLLVPWLRCLGEGTKYIKFALPPSLVLVFAVMLPQAPGWVVALAALLGLLHLALYALVWRNDLARRWNATAVLDGGLEPVLARIAADPSARLMCLPSQIADIVAYRTGRPVLWGTHGYGFRWAGDYFPVLRRPIEELVRRHRLTHLLLDCEYARPESLGLPAEAGERLGPYLLYRFPAP